RLAPLAPKGINSVDQRHVGIALGINNAVSRIASLLAIAVFGAMLNGIFQSSLNQKLDMLALPPTVRADVERQRPRLAAIETMDTGVHQAIDESFVSAYRTILWIAAGLAIASSLSAAALISKETGSPAKSPSPN